MTDIIVISLLFFFIMLLVIGGFIFTIYLVMGGFNKVEQEIPFMEADPRIIEEAIKKRTGDDRFTKGQTVNLKPYQELPEDPTGEYI